MARQKVAVQANQFVGGLNTEANPLNYPANVSADEQNMEIDSNGSRFRRLGFSPEASYTAVDTGIVESGSQNLGRSQFRWSSPGGFGAKQFMVVQVGNYLAVHDLDGDTVSEGKIFSKTFSSTTYGDSFSYASVDGLLVVVSNTEDITLLKYDGTSITESSFNLLVRDFWGLPAFDGSTDLTLTKNLQTRPTTLDGRHVYNLRNQTFALPRVISTAAAETLIDPIASFYSYGSSTDYPSNADSVVPFVLADANNASNRTVERFFTENSYVTKPTTSPAPKGYFIINALDRGASRIEKEAKLRADNPELTVVASSIVSDKTPGGATVAESYAGRVWYSGFSGEIEGGDDKSPNMSGYVLYSRLVESSSDVGQCYQQADPTSIVDANLVDTDGGAIRIDGAYNIKGLVALGNSLFVFAENGVWRVLGTDGGSFVATSFSVERLSTDGCVSTGSITLAEGSVFYWTPSSINAVNKNPSTGEWEVVNLTDKNIKSLYMDIPGTQKALVGGYYDDVGDSVRWVYGDDPLGVSDMNELILNLKFQAFTKNLVTVAGSDVLGVSSVAGGQPVALATERDVTVSGVDVTADSEDVVVISEAETRSAEESFYCILLGKAPTITYTFGGYNDATHVDWSDLGDVTTSAYLETGPISSGEPRTRKNIPYMTVFFKRTEATEGEADGSSCLFAAKWDWTSSHEASKWSNFRQVYRPQRRDDGQTMVITRNKVRGFGKTVAFRFESEGGKDMHIHGWSFNLTANSEE